MRVLALLLAASMAAAMDNSLQVLQRRTQDNCVCTGPNFGGRSLQSLQLPKGARRNLRESPAPKTDATQVLRGTRRLKGASKDSPTGEADWGGDDDDDGNAGKSGKKGDDDDDDGGYGDVCNIDCEGSETCVCTKICDGDDDVSICVAYM